MIPARLAALADRRAEDLPADGPAAALRPAAVLLAVWSQGDDLRVALTRRAAHLRTLPGDVALPGGGLEPDESAVDGALREAHEEIGLAPNTVEVVGRFDEAWSSARRRVVPVVGWLAQPPHLVADPVEVAEIHVVSVTELGRPENHRWRHSELDGERFRDDVVELPGLSVVGFTADLVLDLAGWMHGHDRRRSAGRLADLERFAAVRGWAGA